MLTHIILELGVVLLNCLASVVKGSSGSMSQTSRHPARVRQSKFLLCALSIWFLSPVFSISGSIF
jgi:hypothetical protein